jgi:uncharacterized protein YacL
MKKFVQLPRWAGWLARIIFAPAGFIIGYIACDSIINKYKLLPVDSALIFVCDFLAALLGAVTLLMVGPFICRLVYAAVKRDTNSYRRYTPAEIVSTCIGLICGLLVAYLVTQLYSFFPENYRVMVIALSISTYIGLGITGMILGHLYLSQIVSPNSTTTVLMPKVLDSSVLIDGRIAAIAKTGFASGPFVIPNFVLAEIKNIADSTDSIRRAKGRRALDIIQQLQNTKDISVVIDESVLDGDNESRLISLATELRGEIVTVNYNLAKLAALKDIKTLNINELSQAVKPDAIPGEKLTVNIVKEGKDKNQGLAYLPDGTMIVVENGGKHIGKTVETDVTTSLQTSTGRIIFVRIPE